jgi:WD40 repeat protein
MTGGFYVHSYPKQTEIYVDGKLAKQTDFFFDSALAENLLPRKYKFEIKKTGYQPWEKNLEIKEKEVTEARNITLFPQKVNFGVEEKNISSILSSPDGKKIALRQTDEAGWNLKLYDMAQSVTIRLAGQSNFAAKNPVFNNWEWDSAGKILNISIAAAAATSSYAIAIDKNPPQIAKNAATAETASSTAKLATQNSNGAEYYLSADGYIYKKNPGANPAKAIDAQIEVKPEIEYGLQIFGNYYFVKAGASLLAYNQNSKSFDKIIDGAVSDLKPNPNGKKLAYCSGSEIWVFFLENKTDQPQAVGGDKLFIARLSEKISGCDWFNSDYLVFAAGDAIKAAETDTRDKTNIVDLAKISQITGKDQNPAPQIFINPDKKIIYLFSNDTLYKSDAIE